MAYSGVLTVLPYHPCTHVCVCAQPAPKLTCRRFTRVNGVFQASLKHYLMVEVATHSINNSTLATNPWVSAPVTQNFIVANLPSAIAARHFNCDQRENKHSRLHFSLNDIEIMSFFYTAIPLESKLLKSMIVPSKSNCESRKLGREVLKIFSCI